MKILTQLLFCISFAFTTNAQIITFQDPVFKAKLLASNINNFIARDLNGEYFSIDSNSNGEVEITEASQVGFLQIESSSISSISGIENFTNLITLNCENNILADLNVQALSSLALLDCSNNQLQTINVSGLVALQYLNCQFNNLTNLSVTGITNLINLNCSYNQIASLSLGDLINLEILNCNDNIITAFDLSDLISVKTLDCSNNQLSFLNTSNLVSLETLNCSINFITSLSIDGLANFYDLNCSNNQLTSLNLINLIRLTTLNCNINRLPLINLNNLNNLEEFNCSFNQLISLNLNGLTQLQNLNCTNNQISSIDYIDLDNLISLNCSNNQLTNLDLSTLTNLKYLYCDFNLIMVLNVAGLNELIVLSCSNNQIGAINLTTTPNLQSLYCSDNQISALNLNSLINLQNLFCSNNELTSLFIKNGSFENNLQFSGNSNLEFICADLAENDYVQDEINNNNYTNCHVNSYCSFTPGGDFYLVQGTTKFDSNNNGCDILDIVYPNLQLSISDGSITENLISNISGNYSKSLKSGSYTITPVIENSNYFLLSPTTVSVDFLQMTTPFTQNFCVTPNGNHSDVEIAIFPINNAIPGQFAKYKIVYKNKGTITQSGSINFNFNDTVLDLVLSNPVVISQSSNNLNWSFTNLNPLEARTIFVTLNVNSSLDTFPVNVGQLLAFTATVVTATTDESPNDNTTSFNQIVKNSDIANDKICIEGSSVSSSQIGQYVHYCIRFKNNGTGIAQNIVVKDIIDTTKYDFTSLVPIDGSHLFETRLTNLNTVEFIFENINLAFGATNSTGYVVFKIKTLPTLSVGDTFSNTASIYFDYETPLVTNTESTLIQVLSNQAFGANENMKLYPNPVKNILNVDIKNTQKVNSLSIYNSLGQLVKMIANPINFSIDVSALQSGIYFINASFENEVTSIKFIKE